MPITSTVRRAAATGYGSPFIDGPRDVEEAKVDISGMTYADGSGGEVDADGYLIPGVPLKLSGGLLVLCDGTSGESVYGVVVAPVKVPGVTRVAADADLDALTDFPVAVARGGLVNRDMGEDNMGRAYSANEIAAFAAAGSRLALSAT